MQTMRQTNGSSWFEGYQSAGWDEMVAANGSIRPHYEEVASRLAELTPADIQRRHRLADLTMRQQGITFTVYGRDQGVERGGGVLREFQFNSTNPGQLAGSKIPN